MLKNEAEREILALVLLAIIVASLLGTWAIINVLNQRPSKTIDSVEGGARVTLEILPPLETPRTRTLQTPNEGEPS
ncbi:hypothetical protein HYS50_02905 [Candidatus Woesearchaeota archaeon]|nr:hypothetical protein [Candidatus Woesearchaeota archaeon]